MLFEAVGIQLSNPNQKATAKRPIEAAKFPIDRIKKRAHSNKCEIFYRIKHGVISSRMQITQFVKWTFFS